MNRVTWLLAALLVAALAAIAFLYNRTPETTGAITIAKPAPEVKTVERIIEKAPKVIYTYPADTKEKLGLPESVQAEKAAKVIASSRVDPTDNPRTITTVINTDTGEFVTYDKIEPLPWFTLNSHGEASVSYGLKNGQPNGRISVVQNIAQVKALRVHVSATLDQDGDSYAGVGIAYMW